MDGNRYPYPPQRTRHSGVPTAVWAAIIAFLLLVCSVFFLLWQTVRKLPKSRLYIHRVPAACLSR